MTPSHDAFRRRMLLAASPGVVDAELVDDFHHFSVRVTHDGAQVLDVEGLATRFPWTTCPGAVARLTSLRGMPLAPRASAVGRHAHARDNCTHLFDLAGLAVAHAASGRERREYLAIVPDPVDARTRPRLERDGVPVLEWEVEHGRIAGPPPFNDRSMRSGFLAWADATFDVDTAEAVAVLRRACYVSFGRQADLRPYPTAATMMSTMAGTCYTFTPGIAEHGRRVEGVIG